MITEKSTLVIGVSNHNEEDPLSNITLCSTYHLHIHLKDLTYPYLDCRRTVQVKQCKVIII